LIEGEVIMKPKAGQPVKFGLGDIVIFPTGMKCRWDVHKAVRNYKFCD
tara:strand:- start:404 stop:547 length:144 start_codon:yes stop_codon:yes gene_type:complete